MFTKHPRGYALSASVVAGLLALSACASTESDSSGGVDKVYSDEARTGDVWRPGDMKEFCGDKPLKVALADGTGDNAFRKTARAEFEDEAAKCSNLTLLPYADAQNNPQKAISDIKGLVAKGADVIVVFPDAGEALLPTLREATKAGVAVVPWTANPGGKPGTDYTTFVGHNTVNDGKTWTKWTCEHLGDKGGNVLFLGWHAGQHPEHHRAHGHRGRAQGQRGLRQREAAQQPRQADRHQLEPRPDPRRSSRAC
ncbi:substrate-binding domain-containing protein [Aeromicrobium sp. UC242_57]|uniref:substrate-binding domain-containing protein n=1 Tax=Aeromicrobium sp. UC242_57 TaxID=3374624 RepID=UPI0037978238